MKNTTVVHFIEAKFTQLLINICLREVFFLFKFHGK